MIERPRSGAIAWFRRRCRFVSDPEPVEYIQTEQVSGMTLRDLELISRYAMVELAAPWFGEDN